MVKVILGSCGAFLIFDNIVSRKTEGNLDPGVSTQCTQGTFDS